MAAGWQPCISLRPTTVRRRDSCPFYPDHCTDIILEHFINRWVRHKKIKKIYKKKTVC